VARDDDEPTRDARTPPKATDERPQLSAAERALRRATEGLEGDGSLHATLKTSVGDLDCELHEERVPLTVANFVGLARGTREWLDPERDELVDRPLYRDLPFHRVVPGFAVQTGDPTGSGEGGPGYEFEDEFHPELRHDAPGVLSMANHGPNTNGSQFFVTLAPAPHLDGRHTIFGQCETGGVLDALANPDEGDAPVLRSVHIHRETSPASVASDG
jgi:peptidyl-prolyl cis-trans isomerase A (cyclophilin A)